jgi:hypothetical protein
MSPGIMTDKPYFQQSPVENLSPARVASPARPQSSETQRHGPDPDPGPVTVDMVYPMLEEKDSFNPFMNPLNTRAEKSLKIMDLPGIGEARSKIEERMGRDQVSISLFDLSDHI